jgi:hypothetical protein
VEDKTIPKVKAKLDELKRKRDNPSEKKNLFPKVKAKLDELKRKRDNPSEKRIQSNLPQKIVFS